MNNNQPVILASGSAIRAAILKHHEIAFSVIKPGADESVIKTQASASGMGLEETAMQLAEAKCMAVAKNQKGIVIGADQILEFRGEAYDKPVDMAEARARLSEMQGETHSLINATVAARDGEIVWRNLERPRLTIRSMTGAEIDAYFEEVGDGVLSSVGAYQVETPAGAGLFKRISGDWFTVQGIAIYPLLAELRRQGVFGEQWKNPKPTLAGVIGFPISHSLSPLIHNEWARRARIEGEYRAIEVASDYDAFATAMDELQAQGFAGANVTIPHKENALRYAYRASDAAKTIGAANMLTFGDNAYADNSDSAGFKDALWANAPGANIETAMVLGAGGAARGVVAALRDIGCKEIRITNRTREKAEALGKEFGLEVMDWSARLPGLDACDLLVNTTSLGMTGQPALEIDLADLRSNAIVYDIVYAPLETPLLRNARERGAATINGLEMLMHQARPGFAAWFGNRPYPVSPRVDDDLRELLVGTLKKRGAA